MRLRKPASRPVIRASCRTPVSGASRTSKRGGLLVCAMLHSLQQNCGACKVLLCYGVCMDCHIKGCQNKCRANGLCRKHYQRKYRTGKLTVTKAPNGTGYIDSGGYRRLQINGQVIREHRLIVERAIGRKLGRFEFVHHRNGKRSDNPLANLQIVTPRQHQQIHASLRRR